MTVVSHTKTTDTKETSIPFGNACVFTYICKYIYIKLFLCCYCLLSFVFLVLFFSFSPVIGGILVVVTLVPFRNKMSYTEKKKIFFS